MNVSFIIIGRKTESSILDCLSYIKYEANGTDIIVDIAHCSSSSYRIRASCFGGRNLGRSQNECRDATLGALKRHTALSLLKHIVE